MALNVGVGSISVMIWNAVFLIPPMWSMFAEETASYIAAQLWTSAAWDLDLSDPKEIAPGQREAWLTRGLSYEIEVHYDNPEYGWRLEW